MASQPIDLPPLCPELQSLLEAELAAGNLVVDFGHDFPRAGCVLVRLAKAFRAVSNALPADVVLREVNDPHWWQAEYEHQPTGQFLVCGFE